MKPLASVLILPLFLLAACSSSSQIGMSDDEKAKLFIDSASAALTEGDATGALNHLREAKKYKPNSYEIEYLQTLAYYKKGAINESIRSAKKAIELEPSFSGAKNALGRLYLEKGEFNSAEKYLKEAANDMNYPESYLAKTNLGVLYGKKKNTTESEFWYSKAILDGGNVACMASYYRGEIYLSKNSFEKAQNDFKRASKNGCSGFTDAHLALGKTLMLMKKTDLARAKFIEIQQLFPATEAAKKANQYLKEIQ